MLQEIRNSNVVLAQWMDRLEQTAVRGGLQLTLGQLTLGTIPKLTPLSLDPPCYIYIKGTCPTQWWTPWIFPHPVRIRVRLHSINNTNLITILWGLNNQVLPNCFRHRHRKFSITISTWSLWRCYPQLTNTQNQPNSFWGCEKPVGILWGSDPLRACWRYAHIIEGFWYIHHSLLFIIIIMYLYSAQYLHILQDSKRYLTNPTVQVQPATHK